MIDGEKTAAQDHEVIQRILIDSASAFRTKELNPVKFAYCASVQKAVTKVLNSIKRLQLIRILVAEEHPMFDRRKGSNIQRAEFLRYNLENYFIRMATCKDQMMQLLSSILNLEVKKGNGFAARLSKEAKIKEVEVDAVLDNLEKLFSSIMHIRHKIAHEGEYGDFDLEMLEMASIVKENFNIETLSDQEVEDYWDMTIKENLKEMTQIEEDLTTQLYSILRVCYPCYLLNIQEMERTQGE